MCFLPAIYNIPFKRMPSFAMSVVCQAGLFTSPILALEVRGRWIGSAKDAVKLLAACFFQIHRNVFLMAMSSTADMFTAKSSRCKEFDANVRKIIHARRIALHWTPSS